MTTDAGSGEVPFALNLSWITQRLAVGGRFAAEAPRHLATSLAIRRVVDMRAEEVDDADALASHGIAFLHLPTPDLQPVTQEALWRGVRWIREGFARGERVLVHCEHGIGRSALLALCVLVAEGHTPHAALSLAKDVRWQVSPSPEQLHALLRFTHDWHREIGTLPPATTWDELAAIAYRHLKR